MLHSKVKPVTVCVIPVKWINQTYLNAKNSEYDEECTADENNVSYWPQRRQQSHNDQLEAGRTINYPVYKQNIA